MSYSPEIFNRYKAMVDESGSHVIRSIMHLLKPADGYPVFSNAVIQERYTVWQADCRAMDAACGQSWSDNQSALLMPPDDEEHRPCRMMAAVMIERAIYGEHTAKHSLVDAVKLVRANLETCSAHPPSCACRTSANCKWTYDNRRLVEELERELAIKGPLQNTYAHVVNCACSKCHYERVKNGTEEAYIERLREDTDRVLAKYKISAPAANKASNALTAIHTMPGGSLDDGFVKNLFKAVQGVNYDDKCPHGDPFYACMSCSH